MANWPLSAAVAETRLLHKMRRAATSLLAAVEAMPLLRERARATMAT
ncbi:hypothetical protein [Actinoplanes sp. NBRC 103695]|nr:hypothetical protein [Actinoplanes sp. NBRC 103695]GLY97233.1 hypothetical protein Acsp02_44870 [Actinoplanes sp. NBRC 103695]